MKFTDGQLNSIRKPIEVAFVPERSSVSQTAYIAVRKLKMLMEVYARPQATHAASVVDGKQIIMPLLRLIP